MIEIKPKTKKKQKSEGCHCSEPKPDGSCCKLVCFERPNYFCGHLLTDTDLSTEQQYVIEKHKLYNRTLHGWGIVCGLRLTCGDDECCGSIVIDEGYAIDDCGNDLVVCEPQRFDVVSLLKEKGWIVGDLVYDPCAPDDPKDECDYTQCFYVTVCYDEEPRDFTTPFVAGCRPTLTECEPTRIREGVRFDVLDKLPDENESLEELFKRLVSCFSIFTTGPFSRALNDPNKRPILERVCGRPENIEGYEFDDLKDLFCELRGLLLLYFQKHPDKYNCKLADEIRRNTFPDQPTGLEIKEAFSNLLRLAFQHAISCALGELVPRCPTPKRPGCVVLGTVEVRGGCVTHVCNCPRKYVWSFANFYQVLLAFLYGGNACKEKRPKANEFEYDSDRPATSLGHLDQHGLDPDERHERHVCCNDFPATCEEILPLLNIDPKFLQYAGTEAVRGFQRLVASLRNSFNFTDARMFSPYMFVDRKMEYSRDALEMLGIKDVREVHVSVPPGPAHPFEELARLGLAQMSESTLVLESDPDDVIVNAFAVPAFFQRKRAPQSEDAAYLTDRVVQAEAAANKARDAASQLGQQLIEFVRAGSGGEESEVQKRIKVILDGLKDTPATPKRGAKKRPPIVRNRRTPGGENG